VFVLQVEAVPQPAKRTPPNTRLWRLTAERPVQFGSKSCESGGPGEGPFHNFLHFLQPITISPLFHTQTQP